MSCRYRFIAAFAGLVMLAALTSCGDHNSAGDVDACSTITFTSAPAPPADDRALADAVAKTFCGRFEFKEADGSVAKTVEPVLPEKDSRCIAGALIARLGGDEVRALRFGSAPWNLVGFGIVNHTSIDRAEADLIVGIFRECSSRWKHLLIKSVTEGADQISDKSVQCVDGRLDDTVARAIFAGELDRAYDEGSGSFADDVKPLVAVMDKCLTSEELDRLDWN